MYLHCIVLNERLVVGIKSLYATVPSLQSTVDVSAQVTHLRVLLV